MNDFEEKFNSNISETKANEPIYDPNLKILWIQNEAKIDENDIKEITGIILTEVSTINVHCYSLSDDFDKYSILFEQIVNSIELATEIKYKEKNKDYNPSENINWGKLISTLIIGIALVAYYTYRRKLKNNSIN